MEYTVFLLLLFPGFCILSARPKTTYYFIREELNWDDASLSCVSDYIDLVQVQSNKTVTTLLQIQPERYNGKAWIGLFRDIPSGWGWVDEQLLSYTNWKVNQPDNVHGDEFCVFINEDGLWEDDSCSSKKRSICFEAHTGYQINRDEMTWSDSKAHCESSGSELAVISNETENSQAKANLDGDAWIGLSRTHWYWSETNAPVEFQNWQAGQPDNQNPDSCAAVHLSNGTWTDEPCGTTLPYICYGVENVDKTEKVLVRMKIQSSANLENPAVASELWQQLRTSFTEQGLGELKLTWTKLPVKEQQPEEGDQETCPATENHVFEDVEDEDEELTYYVSENLDV